MRQPKYRAWDGKEMIYMMEDIIEPYYNIQLAKFLDDNYGCDILEFIGLKNKDGKEIYEGDLMKEDGSSIFVVKYQTEYAKFILDWGRGAIQYPGWNRGVNMEIIGNMYEHTELLKEKVEKEKEEA